jgi:DNA-binding NarL/FixJ family response regulator
VSTLTKMRRVLIADDVIDLRQLMRMALELAGDFEVVAEAADGRQAITQAEFHQPDLVLLDLSMPVLDGLEALPQIRAVAPDAHVVVLSGFEASKMRDRVLEGGAVAYLEKGDIMATVEALRDL